MVLIGLVLLIAAAVVGIDVVAQNHVAIDVEAVNQVLATSISIVFVAGVVTGLVAALGLMVMRDGLAHRRRLRVEAKAAEEDRERYIAALEEEHAARHRDHVEAHDGETVDLRDRDRVTTF